MFLLNEWEQLLTGRIEMSESPRLLSAFFPWTPADQRWFIFSPWKYWLCHNKFAQGWKINSTTTLVILLCILPSYRTSYPFSPWIPTILIVYSLITQKGPYCISVHTRMHCMSCMAFSLCLFCPHVLEGGSALDLLKRTSALQCHTRDFQWLNAEIKSVILRNKFLAWYHTVAP